MHMQDGAARVLYLLQCIIHSSAMDINDLAFLVFSFPCFCFVCAVTYANTVVQCFYYVSYFIMSVLMVEVAGEKYELREAEKEDQI